MSIERHKKLLERAIVSGDLVEAERQKQFLEAYLPADGKHAVCFNVKDKPQKEKVKKVKIKCYL